MNTQSQSAILDEMERGIFFHSTVPWNPTYGVHWLSIQRILYEMVDLIIIVNSHWIQIMKIELAN